jgi:glyoxylase-like metal-dependent hydrolase (beta-lactamase superfamily II)
VSRRQATPPTEADDGAEDTGPGPEELAPGVARALNPMVRRIVAPNRGIMTGPGTNTYLVGIDEIAVIDPGPDDPVHLDAVAGCGGDRIRWILCTHGHPDHAPGAPGLAERTGALVLAFGGAAGPEPDERIGDGHTLSATEFRLQAIHTPGHSSDHLCYLLPEHRMLFSGDHINNGQTVVINPPDGDMAAYRASLERLRGLRLRAIAPGHGHLIGEPVVKIDEYLAHRTEREAQILAAVRDRPAGSTIEDLVAVVYADTIVEALRPVAARSVLAHLLQLKAEGHVRGRDERSRWKPA